MEKIIVSVDDMLFEFFGIKFIVIEISYDKEHNEFSRELGRFEDMQEAMDFEKKERKRIYDHFLNARIVSVAEIFYESL